MPSRDTKSPCIGAKLLTSLDKALASVYTRTEEFTKEAGRRISGMGRAMNDSAMETSTWEIMSLDEFQAKACIHGKMATLTMENGWMVSSTGMVCGKVTKGTHMSASGHQIRPMVTVFTCGQMGTVMKVNGSIVSGMVKAVILLVMAIAI